MKRFFSFLLTIIMMISFVGCHSTKNIAEINYGGTEMPAFGNMLLNEGSFPLSAIMYRDDINEENMTLVYVNNMSEVQAIELREGLISINYVFKTGYQDDNAAKDSLLSKLSEYKELFNNATYDDEYQFKAIVEGKTANIYISPIDDGTNHFGLMCVDLDYSVFE